MLIALSTLFSTLSMVPNVNLKVTKPKVPFKYYGDLPPANYFDPLNLLSGSKVEDEKVKYFREAELQHGRLAMLASVALPLIELNTDEKLAINYLSDMNLLFQSPFWASMAMYEVVRMSVGWKDPFTSKELFKLEEKYQPGNIFNYDADNVSKTLYNNELSHGRLAMLAVGHILASELATGKGLFP